MKTRWIQRACDLLCSLVVLLLWFLLSSYALGEKKCTRDQIYPVVGSGPTWWPNKGNASWLPERWWDIWWDKLSKPKYWACLSRTAYSSLYVCTSLCKNRNFPSLGSNKGSLSFLSPSSWVHDRTHVSVGVSALSVSHRLVQEARGLNGLSISCQRSGDKTNCNHSLHLSVVWRFCLAPVDSSTTESLRNIYSCVIRQPGAAHGVSGYIITYQTHIFMLLLEEMIAVVRQRFSL